MKDFHVRTAAGTVPRPDTGSIMVGALKLAEVLYPADSYQETRALELMLMDLSGAILPRMPDRLPALTRLKAMDATERAFRLMIHIASLALQIEMLKRKSNVPADHSRPVRTQIQNARRRLRRACLHAERSHLWRDGRWQIGSLMTLGNKGVQRKTNK